MLTLFGNDKEKDKPSLLERLKQSVSKTRSEIAARVEGLFVGDRRLDAEQLRRLENALLAADLGVSTTRELMQAARETV
jgi:fused signal recognition particle receptor